MTVVWDLLKKFPAFFAIRFVAARSWSGSFGRADLPGDFVGDVEDDAGLTGKWNLPILTKWSEWREKQLSNVS
jgi:hypothetical protein